MSDWWSLIRISKSLIKEGKTLDLVTASHLALGRNREFRGNFGGCWETGPTNGHIGLNASLRSPYEQICRIFPPAVQILYKFSFYLFFSLLFLYEIQRIERSKVPEIKCSISVNAQHPQELFRITQDRDLFRGQFLASAPADCSVRFRTPGPECFAWHSQELFRAG